MLILDREMNKPLYQQLIEAIEIAIVEGRYAPGEKLPSERALSEYLQVNRSTVVRAFDELASRNIIVKKLGSGSFVNDQKWGLLTYPSLNWRQNAIDGSLSNIQQLVHSPSPLDLSSGDLPIDLYPSLQLPKTDWQALIQAELQHDHTRLGILSLRETVQGYLKQRFNMSVPIEQILITSGTQQALSLIALGLLKPGDAIGIEQPSYFYTLPIFQSVGLRIYGIPVDEQGLSVEKLDALVHKHSLKMIFVNPCFQNPTGSVMSPQRKHDLMSFCERKNLPIVEDDAYSQLYFHNMIDVSPLKKADLNGNIIYLGSLSKYLGKSIRIGWMVAPESIVNSLANIRHQLDSGLSALPQVMAEHYLHHYANDHELYLRDALRDRFLKCLTWLKSLNLSNCQYSAPEGGFHLYIKSDNAALMNVINGKVTTGKYFGDDHTQKNIRVTFAHFNHKIIM